MLLIKRSSSFKLFSLFSICLLVAVLPMFLTVLFRVGQMGAIGSWVGGLAILNGTVLPFLFYFAIVSEKNGPGVRLAIGFTALVLGEVFAILGMYLFTRLAGLFGLFEHAIN